MRRRPSPTRALSMEQEEKLRELIAGNLPEQLGMPHALWVRAAVQDLIEDRCGMCLPVKTVGLYLKRWGILPPQGVCRGYATDVLVSRQWLEGAYFSIMSKAMAKAKAEGAEVYWGKCYSLPNGPLWGCAQAGQSSLPQRAQENRLVLTVVSNWRQQTYWRVFRDVLDGQELIDYITRLAGISRRKVFLMMPQLPLREAVSIQSLQAAIPERIQVVGLPNFGEERLNGRNGGDSSERVGSLVEASDFNVSMD